MDALGGLPGQEDVLLAGEVALRGGGGGDTPSLWSLRCKVEFERRGLLLKVAPQPLCLGCSLHLSNPTRSRQRTVHRKQVRDILIHPLPLEKSPLFDSLIKTVSQLQN